jgi:hypothetical protein
VMNVGQTKRAVALAKDEKEAYDEATTQHNSRRVVSESERDGSCNVSTCVYYSGWL